MFPHKAQRKVFEYSRELLSGLILLSLSAVANATFIPSNFADNDDYSNGVVSGFGWDRGKNIRQTHNVVLSQITRGSLSLWSDTIAVQPDSLFNSGRDIEPLLEVNHYIFIPETGPLTLTTGLLTTGTSDSNAETFLVRESISVPEPSSLLLMSIGLAGLGFLCRKKKEQ